MTDGDIFAVWDARTRMLFRILMALAVFLLLTAVVELAVATKLPGSGPASEQVPRSDSVGAPTVRRAPPLMVECRLPLLGDSVARGSQERDVAPAESGAGEAPPPRYFCVEEEPSSGAGGR
jgi:hypothetical protein